MFTFTRTQHRIQVAILAIILVVLALFTFTFLETQASTQLVDPAVRITQIENAKAAATAAVVVVNEHGAADPHYHVFAEASGYAVYVGLESGGGLKIAHLNEAEFIACRLVTDISAPCKTVESDQGFTTKIYSDGAGGMRMVVTRTSVIASPDSGSEHGAAAVVTAAEHQVRQTTNAGAAVDESVVVLTWDGVAHHALHVFKEGGMYAVYVGEGAGQGQKIAQITQADEQACRPKFDPSELCSTYQSDRGFVTAMYPNAKGGLVLKVKEGVIEEANKTTAATGLTTVNADITITKTEGGLVTISGTGQPGAAFLLTPGNNPNTVVIIGQTGAWQLDVAFVAGDHVIKLQDMDANGVAIEPGASVTITID